MRQSELVKGIKIELGLKQKASNDEVLDEIATWYWWVDLFSEEVPLTAEEIDIFNSIEAIGEAFGLRVEDRHTGLIIEAVEDLEGVVLMQNEELTQAEKSTDEAYEQLYDAVCLVEKFLETGDRNQLELIIKRYGDEAI